MSAGIYVLLGGLCLWGAIAWDSLFMLILSGILGYVACLLVLWFIYTRKVDEGDNGYPGA